MARTARASVGLYLKKLGLFVDDDYGQRVRSQFQDNRGFSELAMLETPSSDELEQLKRAVAIMTPDEKKNAVSRIIAVPRTYFLEACTRITPSL